MSDIRRLPIAHQFYDRENNQIHLPSEVQIIRTGSFADSMGDVNIDLSDLESMVTNFDSYVRRTDIALDEGHNAMGKAFGWIKRLYIISESELWGTIEFNELGKKTIEDKQYRYLSAEFAFEYTDNESGIIYGTTLFGVALTNRPFVKDMKPLTFKEKNMPAPIKDDVTKMLADVEEMKSKMVDVTAKLVEQETKSKKLSDELEVQIKKNMELVDKNHAIEKKKEFDEKLNTGLVCEAQREAFMKDDMVAFVANMAKPNLTPKSTNFTEDGREKLEDVQDEVITLAKAKIKDDSKLNLSEAIIVVLKEKPSLAKKYNELFN